MRISSPAPRSLAPRQADTTFNYNSQDQTVMSPGTVVVHDVISGSVPSTDKVRLNTPLAPSGANRYVYHQAPEEVAAQSFGTVAHTVEVFTAALGQPVHWAFPQPQLGVN